jgi:integrase
MSTDTGIRPRHARTCRQRMDKAAACRCSPTFEAQAYDAKAGRAITKTFSTKSAAKRWREDARVAVRSGELSAERGPMFKEAVDAWLDGLRAGQITNRSGDPYKPAAIRDYERNLRLRATPVLGHLRLAEVTTRDVQRLVDGLVKAKLAPATIDAAVTPLKALYRRAEARGEVRSNPTRGLEKPAVRCKPKRIVAPSQAAAMITALDSGERALWATAFYARLRRGELIGLRREDIDLATGVLHVRRGWDMVEGEAIAPKSHQGRRKVPIVPALRDYLDERLLIADDEHIFGTPRFVSRSNDRARKRWTDKGLPVLTLHECRHTFASFAIAAGLNAKTLSVCMGHATIAITLDLYGHLMPGAEEEAGDLLHAYLLRGAGDPTVARTVARPEEVAA